MKRFSAFLTNRSAFDPHHATNERAAKHDVGKVVDFKTRDNVSIRLTRYFGGDMGPVILSHCVGVSSTMYSLRSIETNLLEYLFALGYDVWLFDHRLSIQLPASAQPGNMDDIAQQDYPAAVHKVLEISGKKDLQIVAHGVGSSTLTMSILNGLEGVRAAVFSQVSTHIYSEKLNNIKAKLMPADLITRMGKRSISAYVDTNMGLLGRLYNITHLTLPLEEQEKCIYACCHRITGIYGELYKHRNLNGETHQQLARHFGRANLAALAQLSKMLRASHVVNAKGENTYLPNIERMAKPMLFISGEQNRCVLPESTAKTQKMLSEVNGAYYYSRTEFAGYAHVDCIIGKDAHKDVYPVIAKFLESHTTT